MAGRRGTVPAGARRSSACTWGRRIGSCSASTGAGGRPTAADGPELRPRQRRAVPGLVDRACQRAPIITGWVGGPRAAAMAGKRRGAMVRAALESLASVFDRDVGELRSRLRLAYVHDWSRRSVRRRGVQLRRRRRDRGAGDPGSAGGRDAVPGRRGRGGGGPERHRAWRAGQRASRGRARAGSAVARLRLLPARPQPLHELP